MAKVRIDPSWNERVRHGAWDFETIWRLTPDKNVKASRTTDVSRIRCPAARQEDVITCFRKRYWYPDLKRRMKGFFRNTFFGLSRAHAEFKNLQLLHSIRCSHISPLAYGEDRRLGLLRRAFILTESLDKTCSLEEFLKSSHWKELSFDHRKRFVASLGRWIGQLHRRGYKDRDFYARNVLVHFSQDAWKFSKIDASAGSGGRSEPQVFTPFADDLIDLNRDLAELLSRTDRLRAFLAYAGMGRLDRRFKDWIGKLV